MFDRNPSTKANGFAQIRLDDGRAQYVQRGEFVQLELRGVGGEEAFTIHELSIDGAE